jgi:hypothetical protein
MPLGLAGMVYAARHLLSTHGRLSKWHHNHGCHTLDNVRFLPHSLLPNPVS